MSNDPAPTTDRHWLELSLAQQSVWLDAKLSGTSVYQLGGWARTTADLDEDILRQSVRLLMARHDALRLRVDDDLPRQWLDTSGEVPVVLHELRNLTQVRSDDTDGPVGDVDAAFRSHVEQSFSEPLPLGDRPLFRIELIRAGADANFVLWRFHHLIADSASVSITLAHWFEICEALTAGVSAELAPPSSYLPTITADAKYLESAAYHQDLAYWTDRFETMPPPLISDMDLRPGTARVPVADFTVAGETFDAFKSLAAEAGTTFNRAVFALFALVLGRRFGQTDLVTGVALHRRDLSNLHVIGMMAGVIGVRWAFDPGASLIDSIASYSEQLDSDLRHQRLPVDALSRTLGLAGTGRAGLFEAVMSYIPASGRKASATDSTITTGVVATQEASPISLHVAELDDGQGLTVRVAVNPTFLNSGECQALADLLRDTIERFINDPDAACNTLPVITPAERQRVVADWNATGMSFANGTLDGLFTDQARRTADAVAVIAEDGSEITYAILDAWSTQVARRLLAHGLAPGRAVGVRMQRSEQTIVALLGILKAGGVYLPLDPAYPADRLDYMTRDADASVVLSSNHVEAARADADTGDAVPPSRDPARTAYVIYTSGTTGRPKGVAVPHSAAVNLAFARRAGHDPLGPGDRVLAAISVGFDVSIGQLLLPLLSGATVVIAGDVKTMGAGEFWSLLADRRVTHINSVPSFFDSILDAAPKNGTLSLKRLMLGGEALSGALVGKLKRALAGVDVVNMYGPTEACIDATYHVATEDDLAAAVLPIGRPLANYTAYVLDADRQPVGVGVSGELYLGGAGLAIGYVNAADLTAERFVENPFGHGRLYKTGDRARWRADGRLEFLGRVDQQVKIRGFRVEPAEIEAQLLGHPAVAQCVVVPRNSKPGAAARLVAYVVPRSIEAVPGASDLRVHLSQRLPEYMVPSAFVTIADIPVNRNGKLDVNALPSPESADHQYVAPRTPTEERVASLFAEVLGLDQSGATDHFFELGGHSLLATSLVARLHAAGMAMPLRAVFETPTVEMLARRIDASLPTAVDDVQITRQPRDGRLPLSFPQERIWFVDRLQQDSSYNIPIAFELSGPFNLVAAEQAIRRIVDRHEALRTLIVLDDGRPMQQIVADADVEVTCVDLSDRETEVRDLAVREQLRALASYRFDLATGLPCRFLLIKLEDERHVLATVVHHVAFDGWSAGLFLRDFSVLYAAFARGGADPLAMPHIQPADVAVWQRAQNWDADRSFWLEALKDAPSRLELPTIESTDSSRPSDVLALRIDRELHARLRTLAHDSGASLFMVLHAAFAVLLSRLSGQDDVVVGTVTANRGRVEFEDVIGCFVNTLALRTTLRPGESFKRLLARVKAADLAAYAHQAIPFEQIVEAVSPERSLDHSPIFQVMLVVQNQAPGEADLPGLAVRPIEIAAATAKFDLTFTFTEDGNGIAGQIEFARNRYDAKMIGRMSAQFVRVLNAVTADADRDALAIDLLDPVERRLVLHDWNATKSDFPTGTLNGLFAEQAARTPHATAVVAEDGAVWSYADLDARSTRLARYLVATGIEPGRVVGVRMVRSADTVAALLGILKAGGVYLPLDPAYPADRLDYIASDAGASLILESIDGLTGDADLADSADATRLAYVIYTSGTTGRPKGVAVPHSAAVNLAFARRAGHDPLGPGDRVLAAISVGFDVSIGQLLLPLLSGATVVIAGDVKTMGTAAFWSLLLDRRVTHVNSVPSFIESILDAAPVVPLSLKRLMLGGEVLSGSLVSRIRRTLPGVDVVNMYGPTEACIDATYHVATEDDLAAAVLPIGRPLANYTTYVLDSRMNPTGVGVAGELFIGGVGLARGYVNAPGLTDERFVPDSFSGSGRLYKTGDRARWRPDGRLEFLGRVDEQVKIRGFRVEPAEVEAQLRQQPGVRDAAVIAQQVDGGVRLLAYFTTETGTEPNTLRNGLAGVLPDYMVPAAFVKLDHLPLTANGKLDRRALPKPGQEAFAAREFEPPIGAIETAMATLWGVVLKLDRVGRHDNFFELGGHSLLAVTLVERMRQQGLPGDVRALFTTPTIAGLSASGDVGTVTDVPANRIEAGTKSLTPEMLPLVELTSSQVERIVTVTPGGAANIQDIYSLSALQEGILFQHLMADVGDPYLTPFLLEFDNRDRLDAFVKAVGSVIARHDVLRTAMAWHGLDSPVQVVWRDARLPIEEVSLDRNALMARYNPATYRIDLSKAPLLRVVISREPSTDRWLLLMLTHHLVLDHSSLAILVHELRVLTDDPSTALPPTPPYRNFIAQTRCGMTREQHETFFTTLLGDVDEPTAPFGLLDVQSAAGRTVEGRLVVGRELAERIRSRCRSLGVTPASLFHLAWAVVLGHVSGKNDVVFGTVLLGRMQGGIDTSRTVGMFINTLPIRVKLNDAGIAEGLRRTHRLLAELTAHEHASLALAQRCSAVPPPTPLFSSLFNFRHSPTETQHNKDGGMRIIEASERTNYPLAMAVDDSGVDFLLTALGQPETSPTRVCEHFRHVVVELLDLLDREPLTAVQDVNALPAAERQLVVSTWNATAGSFPTGTLDDLFVEQALRTPQAVAVIDENGDELSYAELDGRSSTLARQLVFAGVKPGGVVGVRMARSTNTVIALLGILKAGGVYLPLDPAYPADRLDYMMADAGAVHVLDTLDDLQGETALPASNDAERAAYLIYTSGTTGRPKGVVVPHRAAVNLAFARRAGHDPLGLGDRVLAAISVGFDVSIGQLLLPLLAGATVVIAGDLKHLGTAGFWSLLAERRVTHVNSVPSFLDSVLDAAPPSDTLSLKRLMLGGEALAGALVGRIKHARPGLDVVNMYGPTEACIDATYHVATDEDLSAAVLPIGRPLANYTAYVLDDRRRPVGVGVTGELYLGGAGLALGYVNAAELTEKRFVPDPFALNGRLYQTGDRARWRADGRLEFLGRVDSQVKIRGFRVEPGEIEMQLRLILSVRDAAVVPDRTGQAVRLIAYCAGENVPDAGTLRAALAAVLPDHMVPAAFVALDRLPLTTHGKLDRAALPKLDRAASATTSFDAPVNDTERRMARVWTDLLGIDRVGRDDHFFEAGGDSLTALRLVNAIGQEFGVNLPVRSLFQQPTLRKLCEQIAVGERHHDSLIPLNAGGTRSPLFCVHPAGGHVFCYLPLTRALGSDQPVFGLQASGLEAGEPLAESIEAMAREYIDAIRSVQPSGPYRLLGLSSGGLIAFEMARQLAAAGREVESLTLLDTTVPGSVAETIFNENTLIAAMAGEFGCPDLIDGETPPQTLADLVEQAHAAERLPVGFDLPQAERVANVFRNTVNLHRDFRPQRWNGPLTVLRATRRFRDGDLMPDWSLLANGALQVFDFDCGHADFGSAALAPAIVTILGKREHAQAADASSRTLQNASAGDNRQ